MLRIIFLGTGGSLPTRNRNPSAVIVNLKGELLLFDCGEGTQQQMMRAKTGMMSLSSIFVSHFHADHFLGIPGLIQTMSFLGRKEPLTIYGPEGTKEFTEVFKVLGYCNLKYEVRGVELSPGDIVEGKNYVVRALKTEHSTPSLGYSLIENPRPGRFNREKAVELGVLPGPLFAKLQKGNPVEVNGKLVKPEEVVGAPRPGRTVVYSGDTRPCEAVLEASRDADVLIHDGSFADEMAGWAEESMHSTAGEVASLAKEAGVRQLVLTHISSRYTDDVGPILNDSRKVFENVIVAEDLMELEVPYRPD
ncbi:MULTISPECIES: ribonuclease Z [Methanosarcina]|jgi:ribonuclease Z|uniref:Ribonuclease Z n=7 Tax=Methanosarcina mazei TaxID=2209 RepID=RNZ_METMA|nr:MULTISPECIES: ribonuclease Z [Methanosarcina]Q8Q032.1 RecName: Full=Ribonuclease Z; Short=RNase Z; AltName: Full=tRNA 3 endonuclease; AltName: Full=tRNase Z [Methanosarcina mazei Go1]AAM30002.1 metal dependent hydrolases [Methanosarcina mazei Go1]AGF95762.1 Ribonuclease Z [Methanosarcina mazei Tuc01]AKB39973.1 Ribonuclease Z [Methanosarcina mazei WWM610]AKB64190.1 Ribonuclease Z [Methanosarcina mazei S-6]AKB67537.1 Ribonuclease Z [Methanosarcina mazei LYC]